MEVNELFERYKEETDILSDDKSIAVILYGSRTRKNAKNGSDLDVFVVTSKEEWDYHKDKRLIDGIPMETLLVSKGYLDHLITQNYYTNSTFIESVFKTGIVKKDKESIVERTIKKIDELKENRKDDQPISAVWVEDLDEILYKYYNSFGNQKKLYYYAFINIVRTIYHMMYNYSNINDWKVYDLYTNPSKAHDYMLKLPDPKFIDAYLRALSAENMNAEIKKLSAFINYKSYLEEKRDVQVGIEIRKRLNQEDEIREVMFLGQNINTVEDMLLSENQASNCCYYSLLNYIKMCALSIGPDDLSEFDKLFLKAVDEEDTEMRINVLEELLHEVTKRYNFDYDDYTL